MNKHSEKFLRKRKALLVLPLLALPFITLAFWALGGGSGSKQQQVTQQGINTTLPDAQLSQASEDKMSLYAKAATDSQTMGNRAGNDLFTADSVLNKAADTMPISDNQSDTGTGRKGYTDPNEAKVRSRLAQLEHTLNQPAPQSATVPQQQDVNDNFSRLQQSMQQTSQATGQEDPEMAQMNGMLEKILDIQHPDRVQQQLRTQSLKNRGRVYPVSKPEEQAAAALLPRVADTVIDGIRIPVYTPTAEKNSFYDIEREGDNDPTRPAIPAVVQETQTVVAGSTIKLRLTEDILINGALIPANSFVFGTCTVNGERLKIDVPGIRYRNNLFPVNLSVYDLDALEGIRIPGAISRDASKEGADRAIQGVQLMSLDPSIGAQAAGAGLEAAKGLFSKKVKLIRVTVKAGYPVLLMDQKAKQESN
jgi:conjugative transposon TraM protein